MQTLPVIGRVLKSIDNFMLKAIYKNLYSKYGNLHWWPADTPFEVIAGAVLTQNTAWTNVEKAIKSFKGNLSPEMILSMSDAKLQEIIRPAGFYTQKAKCLKRVSEWFAEYGSDVNVIKSRQMAEIRRELIKIKGIGEETADAISLYAFDFPSFVADAYTVRLFRRFPIEAGGTYMEIKLFCKKELPRDAGLYKNFHALIVQNGKDHCRKKARCCGCPLENICRKQGT